MFSNINKSYDVYIRMMFWSTFAANVMIVFLGDFIMGRVIKAANSSWHPQCLRCEQCSKQLENDGVWHHAGRFVLLLFMGKRWFFKSQTWMKYSLLILQNLLPNVDYNSPILISIVVVFSDTGSVILRKKKAFYYKCNFYILNKPLRPKWLLLKAKAKYYDEALWGYHLKCFTWSKFFANRLVSMRKDF